MNNTWVPVIIVTICGILAIISIAVTRNYNNPVAKVTEEIIDKELGLPDGAIKIKP